MTKLKELRFKASRTKLRAPKGWWEHRSLNDKDVFFASFERSGNTWLRFVLMEILTKDNAGFLNVNQTLPELGTHVPMKPALPNGGRLIKTHYQYRPVYKRAIYLMRDLRDVMLSNWARDKEMGFSQYFDQGKGMDGYVENFLKGKVTRFGSWQSHINSWLDCPLAGNGNLLVVRYEDLRKDTETGLMEMLDFLGIEGDPDRVRSAVENNSLSNMREKEEKAKNSGATLGKGTLLRKHNLNREDARFVRSGSMGGWREKLSPEQIAMVDRYALEALERAGYPAGVSTQVEREEVGSEVRV
ncbi:MAG: sulfotransferase domain-containing protein [Candidatus Sulfotelmatobacter sp.]